MTIIVTRDVPDRFRGFLAGVMLEVASGTYVSPQMNRGVRERVWAVCRGWAAFLLAGGSITMIWRETTAPGGLGLETLGVPATALVDHQGIWIDHRELTQAHRALLGEYKGQDGPLTTE